MFEKYRNADGTYNGVDMMAELTGLSKEEVAWTAQRLKQLMVGEGMGKDAANIRIAQERVNKPWEQAQSAADWR